MCNTCAGNGASPTAIGCFATSSGRRSERFRCIRGLQILFRAFQLSPVRGARSRLVPGNRWFLCRFGVTPRQLPVDRMFLAPSLLFRCVWKRERLLAVHQSRFVATALSLESMRSSHPTPHGAVDPNTGCEAGDLRRLEEDLRWPGSRSCDRTRPLGRS